MKAALISLLLSFVVLLGPSPSLGQDFEGLFQNFDSRDLTWEDKRFLQAALAFEGHYNGLLDGDWGPRSQRAIEQFSRREFGTATEDWHMAVLAFEFFDIYSRDGWDIRHFDILELSMFYPYRAVISEPSTDLFVNWRHANSSLAYSTGIHTRDETQSIHDFTLDQHGASEEPYIVRRTNFAVTSVTKADRSVLYTRSDYIDGAWHTVVLSADRQDSNLLNAVASSISVGWSRPIAFTEAGKLDRIVQEALAYARQSEFDEPDPSPSTSGDNRPSSATTTGTGFLVSAEGHVLTNAHVVDGCGSILFDGQPAKLMAQSADFDLALISVESRLNDSYAVFSPAPAALNSDVTVAGYPLNGLLSGLNVTRGAVSSQVGLGGDFSRMQISAPVQPGNSGGPVIAQDGEVVGVVVSKLDAQLVADAIGDIPQNVNFAVRGELAKLFLAQNGVTPALGTSDVPIPPEEIAKDASSYTGFIECLFQ